MERWREAGSLERMVMMWVEREIEGEVGRERDGKRERGVKNMEIERRGDIERRKRVRLEVKETGRGRKRKKSERRSKQKERQFFFCLLTVDLFFIFYQ